MPNVTYNNFILGTNSSETVTGTRGNDWIGGLGGDDFIISGKGNDFIYLSNGGGVDTVLDFDPKHDTLLFDIGNDLENSVLPPRGSLFDGQVFSNKRGDAIFEVHAVDANGDGVMDTRIDAFGTEFGDQQSLILLGVAPSDLNASNIIGG